MNILPAVLALAFFSLSGTFTSGSAFAGESSYQFTATPSEVTFVEHPGQKVEIRIKSPGQKPITMSMAAKDRNTKRILKHLQAQRELLRKRGTSYVFTRTESRKRSPASSSTKFGGYIYTWGELPPIGGEPVAHLASKGKRP